MKKTKHIIVNAVIAVLFIGATKAEGQEIDVLHYQASVRVFPSEQRMENVAWVTLRNPSSTEILRSVSLDLVEMTPEHVEVLGVPATFSWDRATLEVTLPTPLAPGDTNIIHVEYSGSPGNEGGPQPWGGCHWGETSYFMGVGFHAPSVSLMRYWLPSNDIPSDKATFDVTFHVPEGLVVAGTGLLHEVSHADGFVSYRWVERHPTATYLFTYAISDYALVRDEWNSIPIEYYVPRPDSARAVQYFSTVPSMLEAFTSVFGPYPFDKVGYCITPIGSMEHQTMISYAEQLFRHGNAAGSTAAHELAHMWWGNWVTCHDFSDAWLNEGFAVFSEMVYAEYLYGESGYLDLVRNVSQSYRTQVVTNEGMLPLHDFPRTPPSSNYPSTIYRKGAMVLVMLRDVMGDEAFFEGLREYGRRHAYATATSASFQGVMEEYHGETLDWFFEQWVYRPGYPVYILHRILDESGAAQHIRIEQSHDTTRYPLYAMPMDVAVLLLNGDTLRRRINTVATGMQEFSFADIPANTVRTILLDPRGVILKRVQYRTLTSGEAPKAPMEGPRLNSVYPNPASTSRDVIVPLSMGNSNFVSITIHDALGKVVAEVFSGTPGAGLHLFPFSTAKLSAGAYYVLALSEQRTSLTRLLVGD